MLGGRAERGDNVLYDSVRAEDSNAVQIPQSIEIIFNAALSALLGAFSCLLDKQRGVRVAGVPPK
jgi:hypothetical protein